MEILKWTVRKARCARGDMFFRMDDDKKQEYMDRYIQGSGLKTLERVIIRKNKNRKPVQLSLF